MKDKNNDVVWVTTYPRVNIWQRKHRGQKRTNKNIMISVFISFQSNIVLLEGALK